MTGPPFDFRSLSVPELIAEIDSAAASADSRLGRLARACAVALRRELDKSQRFLDTVGTIIVGLDRDGHVTLINRKGCELLGYAEGDLLGKSWFDACLGEDADRDTAEAITDLNTLFEEMLRDARTISRDLTEGITNTRVAATLAIVITLVQLLILKDNLWRGPLYVGVWAIGVTIILYHGVRLLQRYQLLKDRYARFFEINRELGNE